MYQARNTPQAKFKNTPQAMMMKSNVVINRKIGISNSVARPIGVASGSHVNRNISVRKGNSSGARF